MYESSSQSMYLSSPCMWFGVDGSPCQVPKMASPYDYVQALQGSTSSAPVALHMPCDAERRHLSTLTYSGGGAESGSGCTKAESARFLALQGKRNSRFGLQEVLSPRSVAASRISSLRKHINPTILPIFLLVSSSGQPLTSLGFPTRTTRNWS